LAELSKDPEAKVRKAALSSLVSLYPEESEDRLLKAMADPDPGLRKWARRTLEKIVEAPVIRGEQKKDSVV
jgi:HEAT repeat protein